jgi:hypothetical protein
MRYADTLLSDGEVIVFRTRQHWLALILESGMALLLWAVAIGLLAAVRVFEFPAEVNNLLSGAALVCLVLGLLYLGYRYWQWWAQDYVITNRRLMKVTGILNKHSSDSSLEKINDAVLDQNVIGRILNYGDMDILTASGDLAVDYFKMLRAPKEFKRLMLNQKFALETEYTGRPPSPPLRSRPIERPMDMNGEPAPAAEPPPTADAEPPPAAVGEPAAAPAAGADDASADVTRTLARLADLRDRGAISDEEYAAKKEELLRRL